MGEVARRVICLFTVYDYAGSLLLLRSSFVWCGEQVLLLTCDSRASHGGSFSCCRAQALGCVCFSSCSTGAQQLRLSGYIQCMAGLVVATCRLTCPEECGLFLDQGSNLCPLNWQVLNHWPTREFQGDFSLIQDFLF